MKRVFLLMLFFGFAGCSQEQTATIAKSVGGAYNTSYRDNVIKNWQARVSGELRCAEFKSKFQSVGERYADAANGAFMQDVFKVWEATKAAGCAASV